MVKKVIRLAPKPMLKMALPVVRAARLVRYRADAVLFPQRMAVFCSCCGTRLRFFTSGNFMDQPERFNRERYEDTKQDVLCPVCRSMPRHRILALWLEEHGELLRSSEMLYFAPEYAMELWLHRAGVPYVTADLYAKADLRLDIQSTGLPDESYDLVICNHVLEHVDDFRKALVEMWRILRSGGSL